MKTRRGSSLWPTTLSGASMVNQYQPGDIVTSSLVKESDFIGVVRGVEPKINKVWVAWAGGVVSQHDPDEIHFEPHQSEVVRARMASRRPFVAADPATDPQFVGDPAAHGIDKPIGGGFSIMQNLVKDQRQEMHEESKGGQPKMAKEKVVLFLDKSGKTFAQMRDAASAFKLWKEGKWDIEVDGRKFKARDWKGRAAIEELFGETYRVLASDGQPKMATLRSRRAMEFPTQDAMDKYLKEHPDADKSLHRVKETEKQEKPAYEIKPAKHDLGNKSLDLTSHTYSDDGSFFLDLNNADGLMVSGRLNRMVFKKGDRDKVHSLLRDHLGGQDFSTEAVKRDPFPSKAKIEKLEEDLSALDTSKTASLRSRRAMYWANPDRIYRLTKREILDGSVLCPKCRKQMDLEPYTKTDKLYCCDKCSFKIPRSNVVMASLSSRRDLVAIEFDTEAEKKKYQQEHDVRPGTKLTVKKHRQEPPSLDHRQRAENAIRDHLSGTGRVTTKENMKSLLQQGGHKLNDKQFSEVWDGLVADEFLTKTPGGQYTWEM